MNVGLDTSVVLRLLIGQPANQTILAIACLDDIQRRGDLAVVSDLVIAETYFALQFHYQITKADALSALSAFLASGEIMPTGEAGVILKQPGLSTAKPGFVDRLIHAGYTANNGRMVTFEKSGSKLAGIMVLK
jgi:predicted nucleic-acid-binding protein